MPWRHIDRGMRIDWDWRSVLGGLALLTFVLLFITWAVATAIADSIMGL
jgi:hypothetical protein